MGEDISSGPDARNPDHTTCRNCGQPITWSEYSYVHDSNGFSDCGIVISGGARITEQEATQGVTLMGGQAAVGIPVHLPAGTIIDPDIIPTMEPKQQTYAEPVEWNEPKEPVGG